MALTFPKPKRRSLDLPAFAEKDPLDEQIYSKPNSLSSLVPTSPGTAVAHVTPTLCNPLCPPITNTRPEEEANNYSIRAERASASKSKNQTTLPRTARVQLSDRAHN